MKYIVRGRSRYIKQFKEQDIESFFDIESAKRETYNLRLDHPSWVFWISEEKDEYVEVQTSIRTEPELSL